ncbi:unnamed protein product [Mytilus coruscus]|uniref:Uncharacterized protein n=1 Tax=Mytilus coruscus TaxID=42192 RepID=A0A6J8D5S9_MYTCO|nr:unnamed protein product [Mytilus coruscus]
MYNLRDRSRIPQGSNSLGRGITTLTSSTIPTWSVASTNIDTCSFGDATSHNYLDSNQAISLNQGEISTSSRPFLSTGNNTEREITHRFEQNASSLGNFSLNLPGDGIQREVSTNPFLFPTQSKSDSAIATMTRAKSCESEEMINLRQELDALRNENLQMKNNAQHFPQIEPDHGISSQNRHANVAQPTALLHQNVYTGTTMPETQQRPNYSYTSTTMPEIQPRPNYLQYPNNSTVPNWLHRQQYSGSQQQHSGLQILKTLDKIMGEKPECHFTTAGILGMLILCNSS